MNKFKSSKSVKRIKRINIIYQDEDIVVVDKPAGVLVIPDRYICGNNTLVGMLEEQLKQKIWVIHRIDCSASGVLVFAKTPQAHRNISMQFGHSEVRKKYIALLSGVLEEREGTVNKPILISGRNVSIGASGKKSLTVFKVLEYFKSYTLIEASPLTGRRHQIRLHFWSIGHPLAVDSEYGVSEPIFLSAFKRGYKVKSGSYEKPLISRLPLHAAALTFRMPMSSEERTFEAVLPNDFEVAIKQLRKYGK